MSDGDERIYYDLAISMEAVGTITAVADLSSVVTITNSNTRTLKLWFQVENQPARYTICGTDPTSTLGFLIGATEWTVISLGSGDSLKIIETASGATMHYQWLG